MHVIFAHNSGFKAFKYSTSLDMGPNQTNAIKCRWIHWQGGSRDDVYNVIDDVDMIEVIFQSFQRSFEQRTEMEAGALC